MGKFYRLSDVEDSFVPPVLLNGRAYGCVKVSASSLLFPFCLKFSYFFLWLVDNQSLFEDDLFISFAVIYFPCLCHINLFTVIDSESRFRDINFILFFSVENLLSFQS